MNESAEPAPVGRPWPPITAYQYDKAIEALQAAKTQLEADGRGCVICGGDDIALECRWNPLRAVLICEAVKASAITLHDKLHTLECGGLIPSDLVDELHQFLHYLGGYVHHMSIQTGPASVSMPLRSQEDEDRETAELRDGADRLRRRAES